jgi:hypothetical protein
MTAGAATFVIRRGDISTLAGVAGRDSGPAFKQKLAECMVEPGEGWGLTGYALVFLFHYLRGQGLWLGSEYAKAEQALSSVASVGGYFMTPGAFSSVDGLDPRRHDDSAIASAIAQLGVKDSNIAVDGKTWLGILRDKVGALREDEALLVLVG